MNTGMKIKLRRIEKGYKGKEMASILGISYEYLRLIENGSAKNVSDPLKIAIAELLGTNVGDLFFSNTN